MVATLMSLLHTGNPIVDLILVLGSSFAIYMAFHVAVQRMIVSLDCPVELGNLSLIQQLNVARDVIARLFVLFFSVSLVVFLTNQVESAPYLLFGLYGIVFDQTVPAGHVWCAIVAAIIFMMALNAERSTPTTLYNALVELGRHAVWIIPAVLAVALLLFAASYAQALGRVAVVTILAKTGVAGGLWNTIAYFFVLAFAMLRLWGTVAILTIALRESYRRRDAATE